MAVFSGNRLKELRQEYKITQKGMAHILGVSRPTVTKYESGERQPEPKVMAKLLDYFDVSLDYLFERSAMKNAEKMLVEQSYLDVINCSRAVDKDIAKLLEQNPFVVLQNKLKDMDNESRKHTIEALNEYLHLLSESTAHQEGRFQKELVGTILRAMKELSKLNKLYFEQLFFSNRFGLFETIEAQTNARNNLNSLLDEILRLHLQRRK